MISKAFTIAIAAAPAGGLPAGAVTAMADVMRLDATNTGCRQTTLQAVNGFTTSGDGQVVQGLRVTGQLNCRHRNVVIRDCIVSGDPNNALYCDGRLTTVGTGPTVEYCTVFNSTNGIAGQIQSIYRCNIYGCDNGINVQYNGGLIVNNWIHDLKGQAAGAHCDGIENNGSSGMQLRFNRIIASIENDTSAVMTNNYFGAINNGLVEGNYMAGGQYAFYSDNRFTNTPLKLTLLNNTIKSGRYGPWALYTADLTLINNTLLP